MNITKRYGNPYVPNKALFAATMWARRMMLEDNLSVDVAITRAADYYQVPDADVAAECLRVGASLKARRTPPWAAGMRK